MNNAEFFASADGMFAVLFLIFAIKCIWRNQLDRAIFWLVLSVGHKIGYWGAQIVKMLEAMQ